MTLGHPFIGMDQVGQREVTIVERDDAWRVVFVGEEGSENVLAFGPAPYGGTFEQAEADAIRVASKWDWGYLPPELKREPDGSIIYSPPEPGEGAGARADLALRTAAWALGDRGPIRLARA